jgi:hypothetical protein
MDAEKADDGDHEDMRTDHSQKKKVLVSVMLPGEKKKVKYDQ